MKKIRITLIIIIIINLIISIMFLIQNIKQKDENRGTEVVEPTFTSIEINKKILPENRKKFEELYGNIENCQKFYKILYDYVRYIPKLNEKTKDLNEGEIQSFYNEHKASISGRYYVSGVEDFTKLVKQLKQVYNEENINYKTVILNTDTFKKYDNYIECNFDIVLNNDKVLKYKLTIKDKDSEVYIKPINGV